MTSVLNSLLYTKLKRHFGVVKVSAGGEAMLSAPRKNFLTGKPELDITHAGEYYQVCCPYCNDTKFRLYVNHMYGARDVFGRRLNFLAICYNETACMRERDNQEDFHETLASVDDLCDAYIKKGVTVPDEARVVQMPGPCKLLSELEAGHPARAYLESRQFDPDTISRLYGVSYCLDSYYFLARGRIIIPVFERGKLKGWQARFVGDLDWKDKSRPLPPKYFTLPGMPRRLLLYNFDRAKAYETGVILEGTTDVWSFGAMSVCTFGAAMTAIQRRRFLAVFKRRSAVLVFDPEEFGSAATRGLVDHLSSAMPGKFAAVRLPEGSDPGSLDRDFMREYVRREAADAGVAVSWGKHERPGRGRGGG